MYSSLNVFFFLEKILKSKCDLHDTKFDLRDTLIKAQKGVDEQHLKIFSFFLFIYLFLRKKALFNRNPTSKLAYSLNVFITMAHLERSLFLGIQASLRLRRMVSLSLFEFVFIFTRVMHMHTCAKFISHNKIDKPIGNEKFADTVLKFLLYYSCVQMATFGFKFGFETIDLKCLDLKSFDFKIPCLGLFKQRRI